MWTFLQNVGLGLQDGGPCAHQVSQMTDFLLSKKMHRAQREHFLSTLDRDDCKSLFIYLLFSSGPSPDKLNQAQVTIYSRETCNRRQVLDGQVFESMLCAGRLQGGVDACQASLMHACLQRTPTHTRTSTLT